MMVYSVNNLPNVLSRLLQARLRDVAGSLDVDRIIEDTAILDRVAGELDIIACNWGVKIEMVKIQKVSAHELEEVLAQKKDGTLDPAVGAFDIKKVGTQVKQGEPLIQIAYNDESKMEQAMEYFRSAYRLAPKRPNAVNLVVERVA